MRRDLEHLEEQREEMVSRNEKIAGENMQMILEAQELAKVKTDMNATLSEVQRKYKELERDNNRLKARLDEQSSRLVENRKSTSPIVEKKSTLESADYCSPKPKAHGSTLSIVDFSTVAFSSPKERSVKVFLKHRKYLHIVKYWKFSMPPYMPHCLLGFLVAFYVRELCRANSDHD